MPNRMRIPCLQQGKVRPRSFPASFSAPSSTDELQF